ncbi:MAG: hypothetical protein N2C13_01895 [Chloroflexota bacterium]
MTKPIPEQDNPDDMGAKNNMPKIIDTSPEITDPQPKINEEKVESPRKRKIKRVIYGTLAILFVLVLALLAGSQSGSVIKSDNIAISRAVEAVIQFELGARDMQAGRCDFARQRFEAVVSFDPEYPEITQNLAQAYICISSTGTPTTVPTATLTPTPDVRNPEDIFTEAQTLMLAEEWDLLLETLDTLRKNDPDYLPVKVGGLYFLALRNRGEQRILVEGLLEGGIFDLSRAEQFGPIDAQADAYRLWASLYISGLSYWDINWEQVVFYYEQVVPLAPNLWDGNYFAVDRLATASVYYSDELILLGDFYLAVRGWCDARDAYRKAASYSPLSVAVQPTADYAVERCEFEPEATPRAQP